MTDCNCEVKKGPLFDRDYVYKLIDGERDYQDVVQKNWDDSSWTPNDWVVFIERYCRECKERTGTPYAQMDAIRKIGALAVAAMEHIETYPR